MGSSSLMHRRATTIPSAALTAGILALAAGASVSPRPALAQAATPAVPAEGGPLRVTVKTIDEGECKIGEGGAGLYRNASGRRKCGLYPAPDGTIFLVVDEG